jgi:hypothetical protein
MALWWMQLHVKLTRVHLVQQQQAGIDAAAAAEQQQHQQHACI